MSHDTRLALDQIAVTLFLLACSIRLTTHSALVTAWVVGGVIALATLLTLSYAIGELWYTRHYEQTRGRDGDG